MTELQANVQQEPSMTQERLQNRRVAIATTTFYKDWLPSQSATSMNADQIRGDLAIEAIKVAVEKGYQLAVVDGGSSAAFKDALSVLGIRVIDQEEKGMSASRRQVFQEAAILRGVDAICWTEPEKISMVENLGKAVKPILEGRADIVVPTRTAESYKTYPEQQVKSEQKANHLFSEVLRLTGLLPIDNPDLDTFFGPRVFRNEPEIVQLFTRQYQLKDDSRLSTIVKPDSYLNSTFFPIILALEEKKRVMSVSIDYHHPQSQTNFEKRNTEFEAKWVTQKQDIVSGAIQLARFFINNPQKPSELLASNNSV